MIILVHHYVTILLAKMLIWAPFLQSMCTFYFCINPCILKKPDLPISRNIQKYSHGTYSLQLY